MRPSAKKRTQEAIENFGTYIDTVPVEVTVISLLASGIKRPTTANYVSKIRMIARFINGRFKKLKVASLTFLAKNNRKCWASKQSRKPLSTSTSTRSTWRSRWLDALQGRDVGQQLAASFL